MKPDPYHLPKETIKAATQLADTMKGFNHLPLNQQVLLASMLGGGIGGAYRLAKPEPEDEAAQRTGLNRTLRGAGRGALVGAGAGAGAAAGGSLSDSSGGKMRMPLNLVGAGLGGLAANRLLNANP